ERPIIDGRQILDDVDRIDPTIFGELDQRHAVSTLLRRSREAAARTRDAPQFFPGALGVAVHDVLQATCAVLGNELGRITCTRLYPFDSRRYSRSA
ncbi:MAG TPA: hypothetical protein VEK55_18510, partial [Xanthobacteraceae bacterium]|nr:hypothetical protein [Xanthobacteraceae bacterium]